MTESNLQTESRVTTARQFQNWQLLWSIATLILMTATAPLWIGSADFPQVPLLSVFVGSALWIDYIALLTVGACCLSLITKSVTKDTANPRVVAAIYACAMTVLFLTNQHRLQPWAWQFTIFAIITALSATRIQAISAGRMALISIYVYSASSKFDYQFLNGIGREFISVAASPFYQTENLFDIPSSVVAVLPIGELLIGVLLMFRATRRWGVAVAMLMHLSLLAILGPWGMDHHLGVLIWNVVFGLLTFTLFWAPLPQQAEDSVVSAPRSFWSANQLPLKGFTLAVLVFPLLPICDHWLAWGLYSPNHRRCVVSTIQPIDRETYDDEFSDEGASDTPSLIAPYLQPGDGLSAKIDLGKMSLERVRAPLYPEARFQLGVAKWLQKKLDIAGGRITYELQTKSDRWTGERRRLGQSTAQSWERSSEEAPFFFNSDPR